MTKRIHVIDGLRGFSLFGILLANLLIFQYGLYGKDEMDLFSISTTDEAFYAFTKIAVEGSFMPIFTFLFGYSMIMMREQFIRKNLGVKWRLFRRSCFLIIIGILHSIYLWEGDILLMYGMMGILLLLFVNRKAKTMFVWGISLLFIFTVLTLIPSDEEMLVDPVLQTTYIEETTKVYQSGTYAEIKIYRNESEDPMIKGMEDGDFMVLFMLMPFVIAPMFLFGMFAAKRQFFFDVKKERTYYLFGTLLCIGLGLTMKTYGYFQLHTGFEVIGGTVLALGYISLVPLLYSLYPSLRLLTYFENVGKLSLTNYITQTVICTTIFYGYGFGLFGKIGVFKAILLGMLIFTMQMAASSLYLKHFRYGPLEKIVRIGTYFSIRKRKNHHRVDSPLIANEENI